ARGQGGRIHRRGRLGGGLRLPLSAPLADMADKTLEFETPHFLHGLFADDLSLLKELEERLGVTVTTRDSWIRFEGEPERVELGASVISDLEEARRQGGTINAHSF